jgi:tetratricopeptide (TPR) repeat protein
LSLISRPYYRSAVILVLVTVVCSRIPLFNYLGFEFSVLMAVVGGFAGGLLLLRVLRTAAPQSAAEYWSLLARSGAMILAIGTVPAVLMLANALVVKNCSLSDGLELYALLVFPSILFSVGLAALVAALVGRWRKTAFACAFLAILLHIPAVGLIGPQIFAFNPIIGFFPGLTYDESLQVVNRLAIYRITTVAAAAVLAAMSGILWRIRMRPAAVRELHKGPPIRPEWFVIALFVPACVVVFVISDRLGFSSSESFIRQRLGGRYLSRTIEFVYPPGSVTPAQVERTAQAQEFALDRIKRDLNLGPIERITVFIYASSAQKGRLIGAGRTDIAKPWLRQVHVNAGDAQQVLTHELAHVLAAEFGFSPLKIGRNSGLIEGLAVAMEGRAYDESLQTAAALVALSGQPLRLKPLFTFEGFAAANPTVAYTLAGSFIRFLLDTYGAAGVKSAYASGDFPSAFGRPLDDLLGDWRRSVDSIRLDDGARDKARYLFRRPSIFMKECARVIAQRNEETARLLDEQQFEEALSSADASLALTRTPDAIFQRTRALSALRRFDDAVGSSVAALADSTIADALLPLRLRLGDSYWSLGRIDSAALQYNRLLRAHLNTWYDEICAVRLEAVRSGTAQAEYWRVLTREIPDSVRKSGLASIDHPLARYLAGQDLLIRERFGEAFNTLASVGPMPRRELEYHRLRRMGRALFEVQEFKRAAEFFTAARRFARPSELLELNDWIERCAWMQR